MIIKEVTSTSQNEKQAKISFCASHVFNKYHTEKNKQAQTKYKKHFFVDYNYKKKGKENFQHISNSSNSSLKSNTL